MAVHKGGGEEASEAPAIDYHTLAIYIRERLEVFYTLHLVFHGIFS